MVNISSISVWLQIIWSRERVKLSQYKAKSKVKTLVYLTDRKAKRLLVFSFYTKLLFVSLVTAVTLVGCIPKNLTFEVSGSDSSVALSRTFQVLAVLLLVPERIRTALDSLRRFIHWTLKGKRTPNF